MDILRSRDRKIPVSVFNGQSGKTRYIDIIRRFGILIRIRVFDNN
jgi:hypothetical protein